MGNRLEEKTAIVTGAGQGVGRGIALAFAREGARVAVVDANHETGSKTAEELRAFGVESLFVACDVADRASVDAAVAAVVTELGGIDILVNNAQRAPASPVALVDHTDEIIDLCFDSGYRGTFHFMQAAYPYLKMNGGRIINIGSGAGVDGLAGQAAYASAKEAIRALSRCAAREWGADGINVNVLCPLASSPGVAKLIELAPEMEQRLTKGNPIARVGDCETDIGPVAVFLASDDSRYVTGQTIPADGGGVMVR